MQQKFTTTFASLHNDLTVEVLTELIKRLPDLQIEGQHRIASLLIPFLAHLDLDTETPILRIEILEIMIVVTSNIIALREDLAKEIWSSLAHCTSNVKLIVQNLFSIVLASVSRLISGQSETDSRIAKFFFAANSPTGFRILCQ